MDNRKVLEVMKKKRRCIIRDAVKACNGGCNECDVYLSTTDYIQALESVIGTLEKILESEDDGK